MHMIYNSDNTKSVPIIVSEAIIMSTVWSELIREKTVRSYVQL